MLDHNYHLIFSDEAFEDILNIQQYGEMTFGKIQSQKYEAILKEAFKALSNMPGIGHKHSLILENLRVYNVGKHIVIYQVDDLEIKLDIIRIVHQNVNLGNIQFTSR